VFPTLGLRVRAGLSRLVAKARTLVRQATRPWFLVAGVLRDLTRTRTELAAENALLRQQLIVASRKVKRPVFKAHERGLLVLLSRIVHGWRDALLLAKPETILRWHREGFRIFWRWKSRRRKAAEPKISDDVIALIRRMARENRTWGAERIGGELLKLGITRLPSGGLSSRITEVASTARGRGAWLTEPRESARRRGWLGLASHRLSATSPDGLRP
jgi:hypothetical protein